MLINYISVVLIAKNAEETIEECLSSLASFTEIILYLNDSIDNTEIIAKKFLNVKIIHGEFSGFGTTKNTAATHATQDWILSLDSDEILNSALIEEIKSADYSDISYIYELKRNNYFLGKSTVSKDVIARLYHKNFTSFDNALVHEKIIIPKEAMIKTLNTPFKHLNITNINQTLTKMIKYTDLGAEGKKTCFFLVVIFKAIFAFIQTYVLRGYFVNGWRGFVIAVSNANRRYYKYLKQYINCQK